MKGNRRRERLGAGPGRGPRLGSQLGTGPGPRSGPLISAGVIYKRHAPIRGNRTLSGRSPIVIQTNTGPPACAPGPPSAPRPLIARSHLARWPSKAGSRRGHNIFICEADAFFQRLPLPPPKPLQQFLWGSKI